MTAVRPANRGRAGTGTVRIIGGRWRRRVLPVVDVPGLRPTPDRVRETLFNWLSHAFGGTFDGRSALDLFAGSGALGFEAASRGAAPVLVVESDRRAFDALLTTRTLLSATDVDVVRGDAATVASRLLADGTRFDVIFLDPPFGRGWIDAILPVAARLCSSDGWLYVECEGPLTEERASAVDLVLHRSDKAGDVFYHLLRRNIKER